VRARNYGDAAVAAVRDVGAPPLQRARATARWPSWDTVIMLAPALLIILGLFAGSLFFALSQSLGYMPIIGKYDLTLVHYVNIFRNREFLASTLMTFHIAFTSTVISAVIAVVAALALREAFRGRRMVTFLFQLSLPIPHVVTALAIMLLTTQSGLIARIAYLVGAIADTGDFPALVFDRLGIGIILVYVWKEVPFIGLVVLAILYGIGTEHEESAATLGASRWQRFRYVLLPLMAPGLVSTCVVVFAFVFGAFEIPYLLGRTHPAALPVLAFRSYMDFDLNARPEAMAMSIFILVVILGLIAAYMKISRTYLVR
jgi:putative spermidine/putrescine transport system permease protein